MTKTRPDYQTERNQLIYNDYLSGKYSYSTLASKYNLTSQRIQSIVKDFQTRGYGKTLDLKAKIAEREIFKDEAIKIRENGNLVIALNMFKQVIAWDLANKNPKGAIDVYGHLRITYSRIGKGKRNNDEKLENFKKAASAIKDAIILCDKFPETKDKGRIAMLNTHLAGNMVELISLTTNEAEKTKILNEALAIINNAIKDLAGSRAHLSWPKRAKGEILFLLERNEEALDTLLDAEKDIFFGYKIEVGENKDKEFVIGVWLSGLHLTIARMALAMKLNVIAKHYATSVLSIQDPTGTLNERKKEAKRILESLK